MYFFVKRFLYLDLWSSLNGRNVHFPTASIVYVNNYQTKRTKIDEGSNQNQDILFHRIEKHLHRK